VALGSEWINSGSTQVQQPSKEQPGFAIWVAVHCGTVQFIKVQASGLCCGANTDEPLWTCSAQALIRWPGYASSLVPKSAAVGAELANALLTTAVDNMWLILNFKTGKRVAWPDEPVCNGLTWTGKASLADARHGASSKASSNADVLTLTAADQLNDECLLTPTGRTDSDGLDDG
jgi:hypothetical protein